ncbi:replicative DNA helicase [Psychrosphaera sp. B3R10]|uniref:replicative DNA helicase n=1 Tax=unclassified Psychrosphaera TaxID=2641570 RepID=UPI001C090D3A|nr:MULTISPECIES: replicative DNA helicase [unclassified Psychrosphaera]MBU2882669.1 replicative DNA helicase [Psychrosphaera sp. I2R16]MBU2989312.1 replicative DNA helicase [Psychrosphaera sp. B3R10]MDO6718146.1 replicative DNA helicase [Psychrosphaera sp. 1_MG-2023]
MAKSSYKPTREQQAQVDSLKVPPHSIEAEQSVLGGLMLDNNAWDRVAEKVVKGDFYLKQHRDIFAAMAMLMIQNHPIDLITVSEALEKDKKLEGVGGFSYLGEIAKNTPSAANIVAYAAIVRERAVVRELIGTANEMADACYNPEGRSSEELLDFAESRVFKIAEQRENKNDGPKDLQSILTSTVDKIEELMRTDNDGITGLTSGFTDLDKMTSGFQPSDLIIVAARPSMGKTTFAMNLVETAALTSDYPALVFSLEMPSDSIMMRMLASLGRIDQTKVRTGNLDDDDWARLASTLGIMQEKGKLYIDDSSGLTPTEVRSRARRIAREHGGLSMIMIDYLQLMRSPEFKDNRTLEIADISASLKALAKELNIPVIALAQLNRGLEQRADKRPINSDLRESGSIEQDADLIMFIYRDEVYHEDSADKGTAEIIIGKHRNGPIGRIRLTTQLHYSRFDNYAGNAFIDD